MIVLAHLLCVIPVCSSVWGDFSNMRKNIIVFGLSDQRLSVRLKSGYFSKGSRSNDRTMTHRTSCVNCGIQGTV